MKKYNETEKILLLRQYIESGEDTSSFAHNKGIPVTSFYRMCREYGNPDTSSIAELMKKEKIPTTVEELQEQLSKERKEHELELQRLRKELNEEKLLHLADKTMIDLAEKKFNIPIRKKSAAK